MSKHRHSKDKMYVTYSEHRMEWGGKKQQFSTPLTRLPFDHCALALEPFQNPVTTFDGCVFDIVNIVPFIKKYKRNPITGAQLKVTDLIQLNFHKNEQGEYHDPISFKIFTDHTKLVAIKTSGNVFCADTVEELNRKPKYWKDLLNGEPFTYKDIIVLQDPKNIESRTIRNFDYLKNNLTLDKTTQETSYVNLNTNITKILDMAKEATQKRLVEESHRDKEKAEELDQISKKVKIQIENNEITVKDFLTLAATSGDYLSERYATEHDSVSVTSSQMTLKTKPLGQTSFRNLNEDEIRKILYDRIRKSGQKGYVQLTTNYGCINFEIHADLVPMTSENFLELCEKGYYNKTKFYKLVENEVLEGGDPTATGYGGESIFGKPFRIEINNMLKHHKAGIVSMANLGPNHQTSQFFITLSKCEKFDGKNAVFGEVVGGFAVLYKINKFPTNMWERPEVPIKIKEIKVLKNPFRDMIRIMAQEKELEKELKRRQQSQSQSMNKQEFFIDEDKFTIPNNTNNNNTNNNNTKIGLGLAQSLIQQFNNQELQKKQSKQFTFESWL